MSINTASDIVANKEYTLTLEAGIVTDGFNTPNDADVITFYTYDNNGPEVVSTTPAKDATNVAKTTTISVTWDETPLLASDGSAISAAAIKANGLVTVNGGVAYTASVSGLQWTLTLDAPLAENVLNTVVVMQTMVKDAVDNTQPADYTWSFTTEDRTCNPPSNFLITEDTKGTEIKFTVDFDEKGKVYYQVLPAADAAPGADDLIASGSMIEFAAGGTSAAQTVSGLVSGGAYKAYFVAVDASANANQSTIYAPAEFNTIDVVAPVVTAMEPMDGANDVAGDTDLMLWFDEEVVIGTGTVIIREVATDIAVGEIVVSAGNTVLVTTDGKTKATITTGVTLASKTAYYVDVDGGTFEDLSGNGMAPIVGMDMWSFTTKDTVAPLLVKTLPDYAAATTPIIRKGTPLLIEFNEAMKMPTGVLYVRYALAPNGVFEVVNGNELSISGDMKTFAVEMMNVPAEQDEFYVDLSELVLKDTSDNQWIDILGTDWNFIIRDETAPAIATIDPANGEEGVVIDTDVEITFTEGIFKAPDATVFTATTIKDVISLKDAAGNAVDYDATLDVVDANSGVVTVTLTPNADLTSETEYMVTISPVVDIMKNVSGEMMSSFTTKDMTAPYVTMWDPDFDTEVNPETGVVTVTFSEKIYDDILVTEEGNVVLYPIEPENIPDFFSYNAGTPIRDADDKIVGFTAGASIDFTGTISEDMMVITLTPVSGDTPLASEAWYRVLLDEDVVVDKAGNFNEEDETIFRIEDTVKPTAIAYLPWGATAAGATMSIEFNEKIALGTGNIYVRNYVNGDVIETIPVADTTVRFDDTGMIAIIKHMDFPPAKYMYVTADAGTITDASSNANPWDGIAIDAIDTWTFSTADFVKPGIVDGGLYPAPGATNVMLGTSIEITFDKEMMFNTDGIDRWMVIYNEDWTPYRTIKVDATNFTLRSITTPVYQANRILSFANANLAANNMYYVRVMEGSVKDVAGNTFAGIMDDSWSFTTGDSGAPKVVTLTPEDNATAVPHTTNLVMEFDREVLANAAGMIMLYKEEPGSLGTLIETIDPTSASVMIEGKVATITIYGVLEYETGYYVIVEPGAFTNTSVDRLPFAGITTTQGWNFRTAKLVCPEFNLVITEVEQLECSAVVDISVEPEGDYVLTLNGDTIMAGVDTIPSGSYTVIAYTSDGDCMVEEMIEVGSEPVVRNETVDTNLGEAVHYMDEESGIDTMLYQGIHVLHL